MKISDIQKVQKPMRRITTYVSSGAIAVTSSLPVFADVIPTSDGAGGSVTATTVDTVGLVTTVTNDPAGASVAVNSFEQFSIGTGETVNLIQPDGTVALVNVVNNALTPQNGDPSQIDGVLNISKAGDAVGENTSKVFLLDHNGFIVGDTGTINANTLVMSTADAAFGARVVAGESDAINELLEGEEPLDPNGNVTFRSGSKVNVTALELHIGAELILDGTITVDAPDQSGSSVPVAVNSSHLTQAKGASVQGGVIRFGASTARIGGTVSAKRGERGGQIAGRVRTSLAVESTAVLDVSGMSLDGGTILFEGAPSPDFGIINTSTLTFGAGAQISAASTNGVGGFIYAESTDLQFGGNLNLSGGAAALLQARTIAFEGATTTNGGDIAAIADGSITVSANASIDTTSASVGGDISLISPNIVINSDARLDADVVGADAGGLISLLAYADQEEVGFPISDDGATAQISVNGAALSGANVVITALAKTTNKVDESSAPSVESATSDAESDDGIFTAAFNEIPDLITDLAQKGAELFSRKIPLQIKDIDATVAISIVDSEIDARGNWKGASSPVATSGLVADNGFLRKTGLQTRDYDALLGKPFSVRGLIPNTWDSSRDSIYIHGNAETSIEIEPITFALSTATTVTDTKSTVRIENSDLSAMAGDVVLTSTVQDNLKIRLLGSGIKGFGVTTVVATHNSVNQLLVLDGSVIAEAGAVRAGAFTGKSHDLSNRVGAGDGGTGAIALTVSLGSSLTEAAIGGQIDAQALDLDAETIYFDKSHETKATLGSASTVSDAVPTSAVSAASKVAVAKAKEKLLNGDDEDPSKTKVATAIALDIQLDTNQTYATLGGRYRDLTDGGLEKAMAAARVDVTGAVTVDATQRFGRFTEGGQALNRSVQAQMLDLDSFVSQIPFSGAGDSPDGGTGVALFGSLSLSQMSGLVRAEIGDSARVDADSVTVDAITQYQTVAELTNFRDRWKSFTDELTKINSITGALSGGPIDLPDLGRPGDGIVFITTSNGTKSVQSATALNDQDLAMGASVNLFETDNDTEALIGDGAVITTVGDVTVTAEQEAFFAHMGANGEGGSAGINPSGTASALIGANVSVPRMLSTVVADVGDATINTAGDLNILANNNIIQIGLSKASGSGAKIAINGAVGVNIFETKTIARLGELATVDAQDIRIDAEDSSLLIGVAGSKAGSTSIGVGASAVINLVKRDTRAEIGNSDTATLTPNAGQYINAQSLTIEAANTGVVFGSALAGSTVAGTVAGSATSGGAEDGGLFVPTSLLDDGETDAVEAQNNVATAPDATGASRASGLAVSGSVVLNLFRQNDATATISTNSTVTLGSAASILAQNTALDIGLSGSVALGLGLDLGATALAGAVAVKTDNRNTRVNLRGVTVNAPNVTADARDAARSVNVAVGGAGGKATVFAVAGSVTTNIERGETLVQITDATVNATVNQSYIARNQGQVFGIAGTISAAMGGTLGVGLGVATNDSSRDAKTIVSGSTFDGGAISLSSLSELEVYAIAASGGIGSQLSLGGSAVANTVSGSALTQIEDSEIDVTTVIVQAESGNELWAYSGNIAQSGTASIGGAISVNQHDGGAQAIIRRSLVTGTDVTLSALSVADLRARALALSGGGTGAVGIGIAVNRTGMNVLADVDGSDILARGNIAVTSDATANVSGFSFSAADGGSAAAAGTAAYNDANNTVLTLVRDTSGVAPSKLFAIGSIAITSRADTNIELLGGGDQLPGVTGSGFASATGGIGASITVNKTNNQVRTSLTDETNVQGFGASTINTRFGAQRGVVIDAYAETDVDALALSAGVAGSAALTGIFVYNTLSDDAVTELGDGFDASVNAAPLLDADLSGRISGTTDIRTALGGVDIAANADQSTKVTAQVSNSTDNFAVAVTGSGGAAVGAAGAGNLIDSTAAVKVNTALISAQADIDILADIYSRITTYSFGASGGKGAVSASVTYNEVQSAALVDLIGTRLSADGNIGVNASVVTDLTSWAGNLAGGGGAGAGGVVVNVLSTESEVRTRGTTVPRYTLPDVSLSGGSAVGSVLPTYIAGQIVADGDVTIGAKTENIVANNAISGAVGGGFVALSSAITLMDSETLVSIGEDPRLPADRSDDGARIDARDIAITAVEQTRLGDNVGVVAGGGAGIGASLNYVDFAGNAAVVVGPVATIEAAGALSVNAQADRNVTGTVGMASVASASLSGAISIINVGGKVRNTGGKAVDEDGTLIEDPGSPPPQNFEDESEAAALLGASSNALGGSPADQTATGSVGAMSNRAGSSGAITAQDTRRSSTTLTAPGRLDNVGVQISADATLSGLAAVSVLAQSNTGIEQTVGVLAGGGVALSASIGVVSLSSQAKIDISGGVRVLSDGIITIAADTKARPNQNSVDTNVYAAAATATLGATAGIAVIDVATAADVAIADGVRIGTPQDETFGNLSATSANSLDLPTKVLISSTRADTVNASILTLGLSGGLAVGASVAKAENRGRATVHVGQATGTNGTDLSSGNVLIAATDASRVSAQATSAQGGAVLGAAGAYAATSNNGQTDVRLNRVAVKAAEFKLRNISQARSLSEVDGLALGALAVGVMVSEASFNATLTTNLNAVSVDAVAVDILTEINDAGGTNVVADALAGSGGIVAGGGAVARAFSDYTIETVIDGGADSVMATDIAASDRVLIQTKASNFGTSADASGLAVGALAVGVVIGEAGQKDVRIGKVLTDIRSGTIGTFGQLFISSENTQIQTVNVTSGSGGLLAGAGSEAKTYLKAQSETKVGDAVGGLVQLTAGDPFDPEETRFNGGLTIRAAQDARLNSKLDNTNAAAIGFSGAVADTDISADVDVIIGSGTEATANFYSINALNAVTRPTDGYNIKSASGGGLVGAAISSDTTGSVLSDVLIKDGVRLTQIGDPIFAQPFNIGTDTNLVVTDKLILDAGGVLAVPVGESHINVVQTGNVNVSAATLVAAGKLDIYSGGNADVRAEAHSTSYGLAGAASSKTSATYKGTNRVNILPNADLLSFSDIALRAGEGSGGEQKVDVNAESRVFNKTVVPIDIDPVADATSTVDAQVNIGAAAKVIAYQNVDLIATGGKRTVLGFGLGKDFYKELLADAASLVGVSLVLDIKRGNSTDNSSSNVDVNGEVRSGAYARRVLYLDENNVLNNSLLETQTDSGIFESNADAPDPSLYRVEYNVDLSAKLQERVVALDALIADGSTSTADRTRYTASRVILLRRIADLAGELSTVVTVDYMLASEGSVNIEADTLTGSSSGSLYAAGEADIRIVSRSGAQLDINGLEITEVQGGEITFNQALIEAGTTDYAFGVSFGQIVDNANVIGIITNEPSGGTVSAGAVGNIDTLGKLANYSGDVFINTEKGSINQSGPVNAENFTAIAPNGSINVSPFPGIDNRGGAPTLTYVQTVNNQEGWSRRLYLDGVRNNHGRNNSYYVRNYRVAKSSFPLKPPEGIISAGRDISLLAEYTNINTLIRAGTGSYTVDIRAGIDGDIANLKAAGGTGRVRLDNLASESRNGVFRTGNITNSTNAAIYYNFETDQIEIDDMTVRGGSITIVSNVISTGSGVLEAVDGFGSLTLNSQASTDVVLNSIDLGGSANGAALEGLVRITDLSKYSNLYLDRDIKNADGSITTVSERQFLTTDFRSIGGVVNVYDNNVIAGGGGGQEIVLDAFGNSIARPANLITSNFNTPDPDGEFSVGEFYYKPVKNRDYVAVTEETRLLKMDQFDIDIVAGNWAYGTDNYFSEWYRTQQVAASTAGIVGSTQVALSSQKSDPVVRASLDNSGYAYDYSHVRSNRLLARGARSYSFTDYFGRTRSVAISPDVYGLADQVLGTTDSTGAPGPDPTFTRLYNIWPGDQSYYSLIYDINPNLRAVEGQLNKMHKIIDMRSALFVENERHVHRFKADYGVKIQFSGSQTSNTSILAKGNIILSKDVFNRFAPTTITSTNGSILSSADSVQVSAANLTLNAANGSIGGLGGALRLDLTEDTNTSAAGVTPGVLSATAGLGIDVFEVSGDLNISRLVTTSRGTGDLGAQIGGIKVQAQGDIVQTENASAFEGSDVSLTSLSGAIYRDSAAGPEALALDTEFGRLSATAQGDVSFLETVGDLGLGEVVSITGSVSLEVPTGRVLDRNNVEVRDTRTLSELNSLWSKELGLTEGTPEYDQRRAEQIAAFENRKTAAYRTYWEKRTPGGTGDLVFNLDPVLETKMRSSALGEDGVDAYIAETNALYDVWNDEAAFDANYRYTATVAEVDALTDGSTWSIEDLTTSVRDGLVLETADTNVRLENANISAAQDIIITARDGIGEIKDPYVLIKPAAGSTLTATDIAVLALADKDDFDIDGDGTPDVDANGNTLIRQEEDLNFVFTQLDGGAATGALYVRSATNEVYLAGETAAQVARLQGTQAVELRVDGLLTNAEVVDFAVEGQDVLLESGSNGEIGTPDTSLSVNILPGGALTARSGDGLYINTPSAPGITGNLPIASVFAAGELVLTSDGALTDAVASGLERIVAGSIDVTATSIGTDVAPMGFRLTDPATGSAKMTSTLGAIHAFSASDFVLSRFDSATGGSLATRDGAALTLAGATPLTFASTATLNVDLDGTFDASAITGPAITGGRLALRSAVDVGSLTEPLRTQIATLTFAPGTSAAADAPLALWIANEGDLTLETLAQTNSVLSQTGIATTGNLTAGTLATAGLLDLDAGGTLDIDTASARRAELSADGAIGAGSAMVLSVDELDIGTVAGDVTATLSGRDVVIERAAAGGAGAALALTVIGGDADIRGAGVSSDGSVALDADGAVTVAALTSLSAASSLDARAASLTFGTGASATTDTRALTLTTTVGNLTFGAAVTVTSASGDIGLQSGAGMSLAADTRFVADLGLLALDAVTTLNTAQRVQLRGQNGVSVAADSLGFGNFADVSSGGGDVALTARVGDLTFGADASVLATTGNTSLNAAADLQTGARNTIAADANALVLSAGGAIRLGNAGTLNAGTTVSLAASNALESGASTRVMAPGAITLDAASVAIGKGSSFNTDVGPLLIGSKTGDLSFGNAVTLRSATGDITVQSAGDATLGRENDLLSTDGAVSLTAVGNLDVGSRSSLNTAGAVLVEADVADFGNRTTLASRQDNLSVSARAGDLSVGALSRLSGWLGITAEANALSFGNLSQIGNRSGDLALTARTGDLTVGNGTAVYSLFSGDLVLSAAGDLSIGDRTTVTTLDDAIRMTSGGALTLGQQTRLLAGSAIAMEAAGWLNVGASVNISSTDDATLQGTSISFGSNALASTETGVLNLTSTAGALTFGQSVRLASDSGDIALRSAAGVEIGAESEFRASLGSLDVEATGDVTAAESVALRGYDGVVIDGNALRFGELASIASAAGDVSMTTRRGDLTLDTQNKITTDQGTITMVAADNLLIGARSRIAAQANAIVLSSGGALSFADQAIVEGGTTVALDAVRWLNVGASVSIRSTAATTMTATSLSFGEAARVSTDTGALAMTASAGDLRFGPSVFVTSSSGNIALASSGDMDMGVGSVVEAEMGTVDLDIGGNLRAAQIAATSNTTDQALRLDVRGALTATTPANTTLIANGQGAVATLRLGSSPAVGQGGLSVALSQLDAAVASGDLHIFETDAITLRDIGTPTGSIDIFAAGPITVGSVQAADTIVLASQGDILSDAAVLDAPETFLFAFGGSIRGATAGAFIGDTTTGTTLNLNARDDVLYSEAAGSVDIGYALAQDGDLSLNTLQSDGALRVGLPGAGGNMTLASNGDMTINVLGAGRIDLIDETARALVYRGANPYGEVDVKAAQNLSLIAAGPGSRLTVGLANVKGIVDLQADVIEANVYDETPEDGLALRLSGVGGTFAQSVAVNAIADGTTGLLTPPFTAPDITNRLIATTRPANPTLPTAQGDVTVSFARFETGEITTAGPLLTAQDIVITDEAWFRQKTFDLYVNTSFGGVNQDADAQILALEMEAGQLVAGRVSFDLLDDRQLETDRLVINRRLEDVGLNGVRSFFEGALTELLLNLDNDFERADETLIKQFDDELQFLGRDGIGRENIGKVILPLVIAQK